MLKNYLKIALRNVWKHKAYSFINIAGLAVGMACALFILVWVQDELSFDRFHDRAGALYRVEQDQSGGQGKFHVNVTPYGMAAALKADIPEIRESARWARTGTLLVRHGEQAFYESRITAVDPAFLRMFTFPALRGDAETALSDPASMAVTEDLAKKYFGTADAVGRTLTINNRHPVTVSAVLKNVPANTTTPFDGLLPLSFMKNMGADVDSWGANEIVTFVEVPSPDAVSSVNAKITRLALDRTRAAWRGDAENWKRIQADPARLKAYMDYVGPEFALMPVVDINLRGYFGFDRSGRAIRIVGLFSVIAVFVLLIACINFMNLATARSASRAKEVGLRKVVGAVRKSIAGQFLGESILTAALAGAAALLLVVALLPAFNALSGKHLVPASLLSARFVLGLAAVTLAAGFVAGSYPALVLSSLRPAAVLKGSGSRGARGAGFRRVLVVTQFGLSVLLLIGTAMVSRQIEYMRNKKLGFDKDQLVYMPLRGETAGTYAALKDRLLRNPNVLGVTATYQQPTSIGANSWGATWDGKDPNQRYLVGISFVDFDYPETMKIEMAAGRTFGKDHPTDVGGAFMVNEAVAGLMGLDAAAAVGRRFNFQGIEGPIVGVMKNFHYQSVRQSIEPLAVAVRPGGFRFAVVRLKAGDVSGSLDAVRTGWLEVNPLYPFDYRFFDQDFDLMVRTDARTGAILKVFSAMAVLIACLGLFGLASFTAEQRTTEIGVRKVLGASAPGIIVLLSKEFAKWVLVANVLAWPVAYFAARGWLRGFAYKTEIAWWLFPLVGAGTLAVALVTVSVQAVRAAQTDPVKALKYE